MEKEPEEYEPLPKLPDKKVIFGGFLVLAIVAGIITFAPGYFQQRQIEEATRVYEKAEILGKVTEIDNEEKTFTVEERGSKTRYILTDTENIPINLGETGNIVNWRHLKIDGKIEMKEVKFTNERDDTGEYKKVVEVEKITIPFLDL